MRLARIFQFTTLSLIIFFFYLPIADAQSITPVGYWDQYSDKTGQLQSIIYIWAEDNELKGRIVKGFPVKGKAPNHYCTKCSGEFKNKRIIDLTMMWGLRYNAHNQKWEGGHILDPQGGGVYRLLGVLSPDNKQFTIRAYIGVSLLGRSQTWVRISEAQMKEQLAQIKKVIGDS